MLYALAALLGFQLAGEIAARALHLPVPGPVVGMLLLFGLLLLRDEPRPLGATADGLLGHLGLLFVPAAVGVVAHLELLARVWLPITLTLVLSTALTLAVTGLALRLLPAARRQPIATEARDA